MANSLVLAKGASVFFEFIKNIHGADFWFVIRRFSNPTKLGFFNIPEKQKIIFA